MPLSFKGGINIDNIVKGALTIMPLQQSRDIIYTIPQDFLCCVCKGDNVVCDDYIAVHPDGSVFVSHVNGSITKIEDNRIYIEWDGTTPEPLYPLAMTIDGLDKREILDYIRLSGLFSETGVPLWRMLAPFLGCADTLIINGAETNPGVTCRHAVLRAYPDKVVGGIKIVMRALSLRKSILVMTEHMQTEAAAIRERLEQKNLIDIYGVVSKYPAESDKVMFSALTGCNREPSSRKTVILSVHDCVGIYDLFTKGRAQTMKTVTVAGQNINVCLGTPISMLANLYSLSVPSDCVAYLGGAIGSRKASEYDAINIGSDAVFYKKATAHYIESECIYCGRCHTHCPIGLLPYRILEATKKSSRVPVTGKA